MTYVGEIIERAYRETNLMGELNNPTPRQGNEGLSRLQTIVSSSIGNEIGEPLESFPIGRNNISRPQGFPWYNDIPDNAWFVPINLRAMLNLENSVDLYLTPQPQDGSRFGVVDVSNNLATFPVTVYGNGRTIEGATSVTLDVNGTDSEWFYRSDLGDWLKSSPLVPEDVFPFPEEFDDYFVTMLALRLSSTYSSQFGATSQAALTRWRSQIMARYSQSKQMPSEAALYRMPNIAADRRYWSGWWGPDNTNSIFASGRPFGWGGW